MKRKTFLTLQKKLQALPLHHIDTSIIGEPSITEAGRQCRKYLNIVGYNYRGKFSLPALGEVLLRIIYQLKIANERYIALDVITSWVENKKIGFYAPRDIGEILDKIKRIDNRVKGTDAQILACAAEDNAKALVTLDTALVHNETLEKEFDIEIKHPRELI
ncbi:MAG: hypothetical protein HY361_02595 [Candidatus Aenigmarchaeota archaeon]|nr:hypothetical protein [Candidatus Aenigmarchaeota archaeon]